MIKNLEEYSILFLGTYPPRECGIATFTYDISSFVEKRLLPYVKVKIAAMNKNGINIYNYPENVVYQINDADIDDYIKTAKKINEDASIKIVNIQHEFGIFGGEYGSYLIAFLEVLKKPVVVTMHSILPNPNEQMKRVVQSIAEKSNAFIVMAENGKEILERNYNLKNDIYVVPHGIPVVAFESNEREKKNIGYEGKIILSSFGMISRGKGYEFVINALPRLIKKYPNLIYLILGETHPVVRKEEGEEYRNFLERRVKNLGLQNHVKFYNKYLTLKEIIKYIKASDIYISSSLDPNQITSGTLVYAMGCGRPIISTPFLHAKEIVNNERGRLLKKFKSSNEFLNAIDEILSNSDGILRICENSYHFTRYMTWPNVSIAYEKIFRKYSNISSEFRSYLPPIKFDHLIKLTDDFGIMQFAVNTHPNLDSGYTTDDNARALIVLCAHYNNSKDNSKINLINTYLNYLNYVKQPDGRFMNYVDKNKKVDLDKWSEDAHGRALWALGFLISAKHIPVSIRKKAKKIFNDARNIVGIISSPRAISFSIIGLSLYNLKNYSDEILSEIKLLADKMCNFYYENSSDDWKWFEKYLTYSNSKMSEAMYYAYLVTKDENYLKIAESSLNFLISITFENGVFIPIGQRGWYMQNGKRTYFDQQPVDVASMVQTLVIANKITKNESYTNLALKTFKWFLGDNLLNQVVYNESTGGCYDGLGENTININQGAESTVSYLLARLALI
ncbi:MAG: glycosyltransferase [Candidatus Pacearchaeota archaeon]